MQQISRQPPTPEPAIVERNEHKEGNREGERPIRSVPSIWNANLEMQNESVPSGERKEEGGRRVGCWEGKSGRAIEAPIEHFKWLYQTQMPPFKQDQQKSQDAGHFSSLPP